MGAPCRPPPHPPKKKFTSTFKGVQNGSVTDLSVHHPFGFKDSNPSKRYLYTLLGTNISPKNGTFESMIFLFPRWDMLVPWRVYYQLIPVCYIHHPPNGGFVGGHPELAACSQVLDGILLRIQGLSALLLKPPLPITGPLELQAPWNRGGSWGIWEVYEKKSKKAGCFQWNPIL